MTVQVWPYPHRLTVRHASHDLIICLMTVQVWPYPHRLTVRHASHDLIICLMTVQVWPHTLVLALLPRLQEGVPASGFRRLTDSTRPRQHWQCRSLLLLGCCGPCCSDSGHLCSLCHSARVPARQRLPYQPAHSGNLLAAHCHLCRLKVLPSCACQHTGEASTVVVCQLSASCFSPSCVACLPACQSVLPSNACPVLCHSACTHVGHGEVSLLV